jgi:hypothetical protein
MQQREDGREGAIGGGKNDEEVQIKSSPKLFRPESFPKRCHSCQAFAASDKWYIASFHKQESKQQTEQW